MTTIQTWDPERYERNARFVSDLGQPVLEQALPERSQLAGIAQRSLERGLEQLGRLAALFAVLFDDRELHVHGRAAQIGAAGAGAVNIYAVRPRWNRLVHAHGGTACREATD